MKLQAERRVGEMPDGVTKLGRCLTAANGFAPCQNAGANNAKRGKMTCRLVQ